MAQHRHYRGSSLYYTVVAHHDKLQGWTFADSTRESSTYSCDMELLQVEIADNNQLTIFRIVN